MIRTLTIIAAVSFILAIGCLASAFAIAGGPFYIDDDWRFHHSAWSIHDAHGPTVALRLSAGSV